jgi:glycosyltransferase involved in cell wall biosynthesis
MLVDNGVVGDSRVQKAARSAADAGWDVTLLGRSPVAERREWTLGQANVVLVDMPDPLARRRHTFRRAWLRWPLAYPPTGIAEHRTQWVRAWKADVKLRETQLPPDASVMSRRWLWLQWQATRAVGKWVWIRTKMLSRARHRRRYRSPWDRLYTWFWLRVKKDGAWRRLEPGLWDYELAFGPEVDKLEPDLIHAHDFRMLGVGARAKVRALANGRPVKLVWDAHEYVPGMQPWENHARWLPANIAHEREHAPYADAVVTVSQRLAEMLRDGHKLATLPTVVLNAPETATESPPRTLREECGIGPDVPLLVYSGLAAEKRGLSTMVEAMPDQPGVHVALVVNRPTGPYATSLLKRAAELGVSDRLHVLEYVPPRQVVAFLSTADVGVIPVHHWLNYESALATKFFESSHARLPLVVSDLRTMAETVRATGQGEVFRAKDVADYRRAVAAVLADPDRYRRAYDDPDLLAGWTWEAQAEKLDHLYARLLAESGSRGGPPSAVR